ncbi:MAG TPA: WD40 repeat domain-containing protein [Fimbriimonadaceae bacterium]|nr:WD40 repeat domain-containing protein [Fimbriimonadaceae bacterium]HRJ95765.1 WD40 repeat domain-containing protein [Fimbriimonadaceae bacterium]
MLELIITAIVDGAAGPVTVTKIKSYDQLRTIACAPAPSGSRFACSLENKQIRIMDAATGNTIRALDGHPQPAYALAFAPNGTTFASGDESGRIWIWDLKTGAKVKEFDRANAHQRGIQYLSFSSDGTRLASTGKDDLIIVWSVASGKQVKKIASGGAIYYSGTFVPGGSILAAATLGKGAIFYNGKDFSPIGSFDGHDKLGVLDIAFNQAGTRCLTVGKNGTGCLWDVKTRTKLNSLKGHQDWVLRGALSPNGRLAATSSTDRRVIIWDTQTFKPVAKLENQSFVGAPVCFTADGRYLISANDMDGLQINAVTGGGSAPAPAQKAAPAKKKG